MTLLKRKTVSQNLYILPIVGYLFSKDNSYSFAAVFEFLSHFP